MGKKTGVLCVGNMRGLGGVCALVVSGGGCWLCKRWGQVGKMAKGRTGATVGKLLKGGKGGQVASLGVRKGQRASYPPPTPILRTPWKWARYLPPPS